MSTIERQKNLQQITQRLVTFTGIVLVSLALGLYGYIKWHANQETSYLVILVFVSGLLGGFVSIQQRLPSISLEELQVLASSWVSITLIPINGGIFALVLMLIFSGHIIQGQLFPVYPTTFEISNAETFFKWIKNSYPVNGVDVSKLLFWSFVAGFSERFVPQIIRRTADDFVGEEKKNGSSNEAN